MSRRTIMPAILLALLVATATHAENWPGWRGPRGDGTSLDKNVPEQWDGSTGLNIAWKVKIEGEGHSSPMVWEDNVFLGSCLPNEQQRVLLCLDRETGKDAWRQSVVQSKLETKHALNSHASSTPATDGELVYIAFMEIDGHTIPAPNVGRARPITPGEIVVAAYQLDGKLRWKAKVGEFISAHGFSSNPLIFEDLVIINGDHDGDSYLVALDKNTGKQRWRVKRDHGIRSYVTPIIRDIGGRTQMVMSGSQSVISYDPRTGEKHWTMDGPTEQFVASMVYDGRFFFLTAGFPDRHILAIRPDGKGNVTDTHIAWRTNRGAAYVPSPIVVGKFVLVVSDNGILSCFDTKTGERHWMERIGKGYSASPVTANGLAYFTADDGITTVVRPGVEYRQVAKNALGELCSSSVAVSHGGILIRGHEHLVYVKQAAGK